MSEQYTRMAYWGKDVANRLGIGRSTLTKWCLALENQGYSFVRGENNSRAFIEQDIFVLQHMKELVQAKNLTLDTAVNVILSRFDFDRRTDGVREENTLSKTEDSHAIQSQEQLGEQENKGMVLLFQHMEKMESEFLVMKQELQDIKTQNEYLKEIIRNQEKQQAQIEHNRFSKEVKRDEQLMLLIRDMQETKKMIVASEQKKSFWNRLFGK
ncbi:DUF3967 domain-containing protein [Bacillus sp. SRB_331]|uniref:DUF3967 domain-containing protein n=1 Tax=Bacillus sp. SRB_331 TaxID=1969379 RepID=UPI000DC3DFEB|nr:DUF3967 domain-containing protein [Bacillus sp. SRB_331]RAN79642.1 hypothetical protein B5P42_16385 [Bacillus sp. SRB_331]